MISITKRKPPDLCDVKVPGVTKKCVTSLSHAKESRLPLAENIFKKATSNNTTNSSIDADRQS